MGGITRSRCRASQARERRWLHLRVPVSGPLASVASTLEGCVWVLQCSQTVSMGIGDAFAGLCGWVVPFLSEGLWVPKASGPLLYVSVCVCASTWLGVLCCVC